jgi:Na+-translocating ferredoxin:NAD+ oxidoreductase RnfC subunit
MGNVQILLRQHVGAPCAAIVKAGDEVKKGTLIATPTGLGANIFSSVYGVVEEVLEDRIVIKPDEEQKDEFVPIDVPADASKLDMVKAAGVVGMGGAGFPTGVKIGTDLNGGYVLVNAAECEQDLNTT